jgi:hypothetical protein
MPSYEMPILTKVKYNSSWHIPSQTHFWDLEGRGNKVQFKQTSGAKNVLALDDSTLLYDKENKNFTASLMNSTTLPGDEMQ